MTKEMKDARMEKVDRVWDYLGEMAKCYGFTVKEYGNGRKEIWDDTRTVNFTVSEHYDFDPQARIEEITYSVTASIATMGGNHTGFALQKMGARIAQAGALVNHIAEFHGSLTVKFDY